MWFISDRIVTVAPSGHLYVNLYCIVIVPCFCLLTPLCPCVTLFSLSEILAPVCLISYSHYSAYNLHPILSLPLFLPSHSHFPLTSHCPPSLLHHDADPQSVCLSVCAPVHGQISLSSELQPGSLPPDADADESSSDMLVIVDDPVSSAPQSRATNSPSSVSGSVSDNMNGESV